MGGGGESVWRVAAGGGSDLCEGLTLCGCSKAYRASWIQGFKVALFISVPKVVAESEDDEDDASLAICSNRLILDTVENKVATISSLLRFNCKTYKIVQS